MLNNNRAPVYVLFGHLVSTRVAILPVSYVDGRIANVAMAGLGLSLGQSNADKENGN